MKQMILVLAVALGIGGCTAYKTKQAAKECYKKYHLSDEECDRFSHSNDTIYYDDTKLGYVQNVEHELLPGEPDLRMEISITQWDPYNTGHTELLIKYVHTKHPRAKVEINSDEPNKFTK